jgi:hypothetical protein
MHRIALVALTLAAVGCSSSVGTNPLEGAVAAPSRPVIGKLQSHDRSVTLLASHDGLRVTVEDATGKVLAHDVDVEAVRGIDPVVYEMCRSSLASNAPVDASLHLDTRAAPAEGARGAR